MVYRGKPSAGCENCRKVKKRCGLEQPSCVRCVKLNKECSGYRDTSGLQVEDETKAVMLKASRQRDSAPTVSAQSRRLASKLHATSSTLKDRGSATSCSAVQHVRKSNQPRHYISTALPVDPREVAFACFFNELTAGTGPWSFLRTLAKRRELEPVVDAAVQACGMAMLSNQRNEPSIRNYTRLMYSEALSRLNKCLEDPTRRKDDASLIAVGLAGHYEIITCDSLDSVTSWRTHIQGCTQLLRLRGASQFANEIGRTLYRDLASQILMNCLWTKCEPPKFLVEWHSAIDTYSSPKQPMHPFDGFNSCCYTFGVLRSRLNTGLISTDDALVEAAAIERQLVEWRLDTIKHHPLWRFASIDVEDSPQVWNRSVHSFQALGAATTWNLYRMIYILLLRLQDDWSSQQDADPTQRLNQAKARQAKRRVLMYEIVASVPSQLGHAFPAYNSASLLSTSYASVWPLFFACTCAMEAIGRDAWEKAMSAMPDPDEGRLPFGEDLRLARWILSRLDHIAQTQAMRWAGNVASALRGHSALRQDMLPVNRDEPPWGLRESGDNNPNTTVTHEIKLIFD